MTGSLGYGNASSHPAMPFWGIIMNQKQNMKAKKIILTILILLLLFTLASRVSAYTARLLIHEGMTYGTITNILGSEGQSCNLGLLVYEWSFPDGSVMTIWLAKPPPLHKASPISEYSAHSIEVSKGSLFPNSNPA